MSKANPLPKSVSNGADYFAQLQKAWMSEYEETAKLFHDSMMVDGRPPMTVQNSEIGMWQSLSAMRATGDPRYWQDPQAQAMYAQLAAKYGGTNPAVQFGGATA